MYKPARLLIRRGAERKPSIGKKRLYLAHDPCGLCDAWGRGWSAQRHRNAVETGIKRHKGLSYIEGTRGGSVSLEMVSVRPDGRENDAGDACIERVCFSA